MQKTWRECDACGIKMAQYAPRKKMGDRFLCPDCARKAKIESQASADHEVLYHITDKHYFALDPDYAPEDNALAVRSRAGIKGIYLTSDPDHWRALGYHRPYVAEIHMPKGLAVDGRWGGERFLPAEHFGSARVHRVMPFDEHQRERWNTETGTIEDYLGPASTPPGKDVRDFTPEEHAHHLRRFRDYKHDVQGWGWNEFNDQDEHVGTEETDYEGMPVRRDREGNVMTIDRYSKKKPRAKMTAVRKVAHDSGDGMSIYHCPFCGSGQVIARSDGTVECQFCHNAFTVQVQPQYPAFPQTVDGMPVQVPGMPGQVGGPPVPMDPSALGPDGEPIDSSVEGEGGIAPGEDEEAPPGDEEGEGGGDGPPWAKKSYRTPQGAVLDGLEFVHHVAIKTSPDPLMTARMIRESRKA